MNRRMSGIIDQWSNNENIYSHGIIRKNCIARKLSEGEASVQFVCVGTFVQVNSIRDDNVIFCVVRNNMQIETDQLVCSRSDVIYVPENLWGPLFPVEPSARLPLVEDIKMAECMGNISVGHRVQILGPDNKVICTGNVTFRNSIVILGAGVYFGLKIENSKDNLQGVIKKISLLEPGTKGFPRGCDIVVAVDKIRPNINFHNKDKLIYHHDKENQKQSLKSPIAEDVNGTSYKSTIVLNLKDKFSNNSKKIHVNHHTSHLSSESNLNHSSVKRSVNSDNPLAVGDRVVYLHGNTLEKGIVRWMGNLKNSFKVGIEFDNPIGHGSGTVDDIELFRTKLDHALIVPPSEIIKLSDSVLNNTNDTFMHKNNNINFNNNINNNNANNNYNLRQNDFCFDNKSTNEEKHKVVRSNSHQCLKHRERTFRRDEAFQTNEEIFRRKHGCANAEIRTDNTCDMQLQHNSRSFDLAKPSERKLSYRRQCNSVDNDLTQDKETKHHNNLHIPNNLDQRTPSQELFDLTGGNWSKQDRGHNCYLEDKLLKILDGDAFTNHYKSHSNQSQEEPLNVHYEKDVWNSHYSEHSSSNESITNFHDSPKPTDLGVGSVVEIVVKGEPHYGVIRWIGTIPDSRDPDSSRLIAGIEMEEEENCFTDGTFNSKRYFQCNPKRAFFIPLSKCRKDSRFVDDVQKQSAPSEINYGQIDCPVVEGIIPPISIEGDVRSICGKNRGIQGHHNSCYLDATLFSMFAFTCVFDSLLYRPPTSYDIPQYSEVQRVLREEIVNPLRKNLYVRADRVMKLRTLLDKLSSVSGLTSEEKDPEEFLNSLLAQILKAEPFLKLSSGQEAFHYQLFVEKDERLIFPSVQQLFEQSFVTSDIKLKQVPSCLIIQMPRFGKLFKMYSKILPPQLLDVTDIIENSPRQCTVCGRSAEFECKDCFGQTGIGNGLESISFCRTCLETAHNHHCRTMHNYKALTVPVEFSELQEHCIIPRVYMELFAVVCIEMSHYVAFVKCGSGSDAPWCFFDSMADRKGEQNGYNIPEMVPCPDLPYWLSEEGAKKLSEMRDERHLPEHAKRLFSDAYMCMYQSPDMMMYR